MQTAISFQLRIGVHQIGFKKKSQIFENLLHFFSGHFFGSVSEVATVISNLLDSVVSKS